MTYTGGDTPRIVDQQPPLIFHYGDQRDDEYMKIAITDAARIQEERQPGSEPCCWNCFAVVDVALQGGAGGQRGYCARDHPADDRQGRFAVPAVQAGVRQSVLEPYCGASPWEHAGQRVVIGQRAMQAAGDMFLGWTTGTGKLKTQFYLRQLSDARSSRSSKP